MGTPPQRSAHPGVSPEALATLRALTTRECQFDQTTITAWVGGTSGMRC
jgi:hypothetical protein